MRCPLDYCECTINHCQHREMKNTRAGRAAHAIRKQNNLQKEFAKYKNGMGWARAEQSRLDAMARKGLI